MNIQLLSCAHSNCGIGRYTNELGKTLSKSPYSVKGLRKDSPQPPLFQVYPHRSFRNLRHYIAPYYLSKAISSLEADIWHADYVDAASAFYWLSKSKNGLLFTNVHDAIPFLFPTGKMAFENYKRQLQFAISNSEKIIVVSETSKTDLINFTGINPDRVEVIYNGINHDFFYPNEKPANNEVFTIRYVGGLSGPHKNAETLIRTAQILEQKEISFSMEIGGGHPENTGLPQLAESLNVRSVKFTGFIPDTSLREFLAGADAFLYPSLYEGFGFPPLEAMASGTATISSNAGSLSEVLGDGAITIDPTAEMFANAIEIVMKSDLIKKDLEIKAVKQASKYTWQKSGEDHLKMYEKAFALKTSSKKAS